MSKVNIKGIADTSKRKFIRDMAKWMISEQVGTRIDIEVGVVFTNLKETEKCSGLCEWVGEEALHPREFLIHIDNKISFKEQMRTLAHEMIHVRQYAKNELYDYQYEYGKTRWMGKVFKWEQMKYRDLPWEKDAYANQTQLMRRALKALGYALPK